MTHLPIPRNTTFWKKQADHLLPAFQEARQSPLVEQLRIDLVQLM